MIFFDAVHYYDYFQGFKALHERMEATGEGYPLVESSETPQMNDVQLDYLQKVVNLCRSKGAIPVLYKMPGYGYWTGAQYNAVMDYAQKPAGLC